MCANAAVAGEPPIDPGKAPEDLVGSGEGLVSRLGLSLSGGGFRAAFFHVGVLEALAGADILRRVEVISAVSGGSVVAVMYALRLKRELEDTGDALTQGHYLKVVQEIRAQLQSGARLNLRTRLFMNPLALLSIVLWKSSLAGRMGRLFERHLFKPLLHRPPGGGIPLKELLMPAPGRDGGIDRHNAHQQLESDGACAVRVVVNATCLNSGFAYSFTANEVGDPEFGYFRLCDAKRIQGLKYLTDAKSLSELTARAQGQPALPWGRVRLRALLEGSRRQSRAHRGGEGDLAGSMGFTRQQWCRVVSLVAAFRFGRLEDEAKEGESKPGATGSGLGTIAGCDADAVARALKCLPFRQFRRLEDVAYWLSDYRPSVAAKARLAADAEWQQRLAKSLEENLGALQGCSRLPKTDESHYDLDGIVDLAALIVEAFWVRCAINASPSLSIDMGKLTVGLAVGASACFPPLIPPMMLYDLYDDLVASRLGLVDGGVYDNLGLDALVDYGCTRLIVSDAGVGFEPSKQSAKGILGGARRTIEVLMNAASLRHTERFRTRVRVGKVLRGACAAADDRRRGLAQEVARALGTQGLEELIHVQIDPDRGACQTDEVPNNWLASIRTDLDGFSEVESCALIGQGKRQARTELERAGLAVPDETPEPPPPLITYTAERRKAVLFVGRYRFLRTARLYPRCTMAVLAAMAVGLLGVEHVPEMKEILQRLTSELLADVRPCLSSLLEFTLPWLGYVTVPSHWLLLVGDWLVRHPLTVAATALVVWGLGLAWSGHLPAGPRMNVRVWRLVQKPKKYWRLVVFWPLVLPVAVVAVAAALLASAAYLLAKPAMRFGRIFR